MHREFQYEYNYFRFWPISQSRSRARPRISVKSPGGDHPRGLSEQNISKHVGLTLLLSVADAAPRRDVVASSSSCDQTCNGVLDRLNLLQNSCL